MAHSSTVHVNTSKNPVSNGQFGLQHGLATQDTCITYAGWKLRYVLILKKLEWLTLTFAHNHSEDEGIDRMLEFGHGVGKCVQGIGSATAAAPTSLLQSLDGEQAVPPPDSFASQTSTATQSSTSNVCAVRITGNPQVFRFHCTFPRCRRRTFSRWYDFNRHYNGAHATEKTVFWCPAGDCNRSERSNNRPFPRKDKMMSHALKMHGIEEGNTTLQCQERGM